MCSNKLVLQLLGRLRKDPEGDALAVFTVTVSTTNYNPKDPMLNKAKLPNSSVNLSMDYPLLSPLCRIQYL